MTALIDRNHRSGGRPFRAALRVQPGHPRFRMAVAPSRTGRSAPGGGGPLPATSDRARRGPLDSCGAARHHLVVGGLHNAVQFRPVGPCTAGAPVHRDRQVRWREGGSVRLDPPAVGVFASSPSAPVIPLLLRSVQPSACRFRPRLALVQLSNR